MAEAPAPFDPGSAVTFDLGRGAASDARGARVVFLPSASLEAIESSHPDALVRIGEELGRACGARASARLGGSSGVLGASLETVITQLAGELALAGIGAVQIERWGRALVLVVDNPVAGDAFIGAVLAGALGVASGRDLGTACLGAEGASVRYFVGSRETGARVTSQIAAGEPFAAVLQGLQGRSA